MPLTMTKLKILGIMTQELDDRGMFTKGAIYLSQRIDHAKEEIQALLIDMIEEGYLERKEPAPGAKHFPLRLTAKCQGERNKLFHDMFPDIKSILLKKR